MVFNLKNGAQIQINSIVKPIILYVCECWRNAPKNDTFANTVEKLYAYECWGML